MITVGSQNRADLYHESVTNWAEIAIVLLVESKPNSLDESLLRPSGLYGYRKICLTFYFCVPGNQALFVIINLI